MKKIHNRVWMLFDGRFLTDEDRAVCYEVCYSLREAKKNVRDYGDDTVIVECEMIADFVKSSKIIN